MPTATATYAGQTLASASDSEYAVVEGNIYFPPSSLNDQSQFKTNSNHTSCPWKGKASYYDLSVDGKDIANAAWFYPEPKEKAAHIKNFVAFYKNKVDVTVKE